MFDLLTDANFLGGSVSGVAITLASNAIRKAAPKLKAWLMGAEARTVAEVHHRIEAIGKSTLSALGNVRGEAQSLVDKLRGDTAGQFAAHWTRISDHEARLVQLEKHIFGTAAANPPPGVNAAPGGVTMVPVQ
jgi:hypothetical protein